MRNGAPGHAFSHECKAEAYNITVNAIIPGLVDTALTRYETGLRESMAENGQKPDNPTPQQAWDSRSPPVPMKVGWLQSDDISRSRCFWPPTPPIW